MPHHKIVEAISPQGKKILIKEGYTVMRSSELPKLAAEMVQTKIDTIDAEAKARKKKKDN